MFLSKYISSNLRSDKGGRIFLSLLLLLLIIVPPLNLLVPESSFMHVPTYMVALLGKYLCFALLAIALDLVWGYCGILSLGHGAFFALGGYAMGMYLMRQIGDRGVYGNPDLPDFMVFLNWQEMPWYWQGFDMFWFAMLMAMAGAGFVGTRVWLAGIPFEGDGCLSVNNDSGLNLRIVAGIF